MMLPTASPLLAINSRTEQNSHTYNKIAPPIPPLDPDSWFTLESSSMYSSNPNLLPNV
jgi:hypothetical protein